MKNAQLNPIDEMAAEIAEHEAAAAAKRAAMQAAQESENARRMPLHNLLQERLNLQAVITRNREKIKHHAADAASFEALVDSSFWNDADPQNRIYNFSVASQNYPFAAAAAAVELLTTRLTKAENFLQDLELKIVTLAKELDLIEILPAELRK